MAEPTQFGQYLPTAFAFISAVGAAAAAIAAFRSAASAKESNEKLEKIRKADLYREASLTANKVVSLSVRIVDIGNDLKMEYETLFAFAGQTGGSRKKLYINGVEGKLLEISPFQEQARDYLENLPDSQNASTSDLVRIIAEFEGILVQLERISEKFATDIENVRVDNRLFREKAITR